jgi:hypothetical protein
MDIREFDHREDGCLFGVMRRHKKTIKKRISTQVEILMNSMAG